MSYRPWTYRPWTHDVVPPADVCVRVSGRSKHALLGELGRARLFLLAEGSVCGAPAPAPTETHSLASVWVVYGRGALTLEARLYFGI